MLALKYRKFRVLRGNPAIAEALKDGMGVILGYYPYGIAYGLLAGQAGLSLLDTMLMSILVYAGASQLIAVGMIAAGQPILSIIVATFSINMRYLLLSATILPMIKPFGKWSKYYFLYYLSDEIFAIFTARYGSESEKHEACNQEKRSYAITLTSVGCFAWFSSSFIGFVLGPVMPDLKVFGLDYALTCVFVGMVMVLAKSKHMLICSILAGMTALFMHLIGLSSLAIVASAAIVSLLSSSIERIKVNR